MVDFLKNDLDNEWAFVRGAARLLVSDFSNDFPESIADIVDTDTYDSQTGWDDLGATKQGIQISVQSEDIPSINYNSPNINNDIIENTVLVQTNLAEATLSNFIFAWNGSALITSGGERHTGFGSINTRVRRRLAVLYKNPTTNSIRAFIFRNVEIDGNQSSIVYNKTGDQQTIAVTFDCFPDFSITDVSSSIFMIYEQGEDLVDHLYPGDDVFPADDLYPR